MPEDLQGTVGEIKVQGYKNIRAKVMVERGRCKELKEWWAAAYEDNTVEPFKGHKLRVLAEKSEHQRQSMAIFLRALRAAERRIGQEPVRGQRDPAAPRPRVYPRWRTWSVMFEETEVAQLPRGALEVEWKPNGLKALNANTGAELVAELKDE